MINEVDYGRSTLKTLEHHLGACSYLSGDRVHIKKTNLDLNLARFVTL